MKKITVIFLSFFSFLATAAVSVSIGQFYQNERNNFFADQPKIGMQFSGFYSWDKYQLGIEYFQMTKNSSGNATLSSDFENKGLLLSGKLISGNQKILRPFLSAGFGFEQLVTQSFIYSDVSNDISKAYLLAFAGGGLQLQFFDEIHLSTEARLNFGEIRNPNPAWSILLHLGVDFN